jgi:hypothetical protein
MSLATIVQFASLAVVVFIGVCLVYVIFEMRTVYADHRDQFLRTVSAVEEFQKLQPEFVSILRRLESDGRALQEIAIQIEGTVAALNGAVGESVSGAANRHATAIDDLRDHMDSQQARLAEILERVSENMRPAALVSPPLPVPAQAAVQPVVRAAENGHYIRIRRELIENDSDLRFSLLKDWVSINTLAIIRRASLEWNSPNDLIAGIPAYLEPEAEMMMDRVLLVGTRSHTKKLAIPVGDLDPSRNAGQWFEFGDGYLTTPALLVGCQGEFDVISKGTAARPNP